MNKRDFLKKSFAGFGGIVALPITGCETKGNTKESACEVSPTETRGPFPNKTPAELMRANIVSDRQGIPLLIHLKVQKSGEVCESMAGAQVDIWHCDAEGHYSEYGNHPLQPEDFTKVHFLRGRQTTNVEGEVSFISIFPGWYPGRAPHIHVDVLKDDKIILSTQVAFPHHSTAAVYASRGYKGEEDTPNEADSIFQDSLDQNMADYVAGNLEDGFTLRKVLTIG